MNSNFPYVIIQTVGTNEYGGMYFPYYLKLNYQYFDKLNNVIMWLRAKHKT